MIDCRKMDCMKMDSRNWATFYPHFSITGSLSVVPRDTFLDTFYVQRNLTRRIETGY
jgi:hypothetical protein